MKSGNCYCSGVVEVGKRRTGALAPGESRWAPLPSESFVGKGSCIKVQVSSLIIIGDEM